MKTMVKELILGTITTILVGLSVYGVYASKKRFQIRHCTLLDVDFVSKWIASLDLEDYMPTYTCALVRRSELNAVISRMEKLVLKHLTDYDNLVLLLIFDKGKNVVIKKQFFVCQETDPDLSSQDFIEFPFD